MQRIWWLLHKQLHLIRRERSGLLVLIVFCTFAFALRALVPETSPAVTYPDLLTHYVDQNEAPAEELTSPQATRAEAFFKFDPNSIDLEALIQLGLSPKQAGSLLNYRDKSGGFKTKADLARVYTLPEGWFERHQADILLPDRQDAPRRVKKSETAKFANEGNSWREFSSPKSAQPPAEEVTLIDINSVDSLELTAVRGIGAKSARRIVNYRDALGGFVDTAQYQEVWGLHPAVRQRLKESAVPLTTPRQIDLNRATFEELKAHPYISYKLAKSLVAMRNHRGGTLGIADLKAHHLIDEALLERITPYLNVE